MDQRTKRLLYSIQFEYIDKNSPNKKHVNTVRFGSVKPNKDYVSALSNI